MCHLIIWSSTTEYFAVELLITCILKIAKRRNFGHLNPLGPKSDQDRFSPTNISRSSRVKVMRITKLSSKGRML